MSHMDYDRPETQLASARVAICVNLEQWFIDRGMYAAAFAMSRTVDAVAERWAALFQEDEDAFIGPPRPPRASLVEDGDIPF
ncbi:hypothetical protein M2322_003022 [Rhodoblastus acidophilus]|uniref:hypothetical protein n=1 Tax=Rhodoblastus acidophilus TaxID=1074 RepID=UPI002224CFBC|nr:hypothetical protein [Rhodoblastus acidophilus]MCW2317463.1 hypothetical protein [Rhodoblastus acidophilus]